MVKGNGSWAAMAAFRFRSRWNEVTFFHLITKTLVINDLCIVMFWKMKKVNFRWSNSEKTTRLSNQSLIRIVIDELSVTSM